MIRNPHKNTHFLHLRKKSPTGRKITPPQKKRNEFTQEIKNEEERCTLLLHARKFVGY